MHFDALIVVFKFVQLFLHEIIINSSLMVGTAYDFKISSARGFNGSVNISESCDFRSQFDPLYIIL